MTTIGHLVGKPRCWSCSAVIDGWTGIQGQGPSDGDVSICLYCGVLGTFAATEYGLIVRRPTPDEGSEYEQNPYIQEMAAVAAATRQEMKRKRQS